MEFILVISYHSLNVFSKSFKNEIDIFFKIYLLNSLWSDFSYRTEICSFFLFWLNFWLTEPCRRFWNFLFFLGMTVIKVKLELSDILEKGRIVWTSCDTNQLWYLIEITQHTDKKCLVFNKVKIASYVNLPQRRKNKGFMEIARKRNICTCQVCGCDRNKLLISRHLFRHLTPLW